MLYFRRQAPLDTPDLKQMVKDLRPQIPKLAKIELEYGYIVVTNSDLSHQQRRWLEKLLPGVDKEGYKYKPSHYYYDFWLVPRFGTTPAVMAAAREVCLLTGLPAVLKIIE